MTSRKLTFIQVSQLTRCPLYVSPFLSSTSFSTTTSRYQSIMWHVQSRFVVICTIGWPCAVFRSESGSYIHNDKDTVIPSLISTYTEGQGSSYSAVSFLYTTRQVKCAFRLFISTQRTIFSRQQLASLSAGFDRCAVLSVENKVHEKPYLGGIVRIQEKLPKISGWKNETVIFESRAATY